MRNVWFLIRENSKLKGFLIEAFLKNINFKSNAEVKKKHKKRDISDIPNLELNNNRPGSFYKLSYLDDEVTSPAIFILQKYKKKSSFQVKLFTEFKMLIKLFYERNITN